MDCRYENRLGKPSLLIVEHDRLQREMYIKAIAAYVDVVFEASNGIEGLELYQRFRPAIILSAINIPIMDGVTFCKKIRQEDQDIPILVISSCDEATKLIDLIPLKLFNYLLKPASSKILIDNMRKIVAMEYSRANMKRFLSPNAIYLVDKKAIERNEQCFTLTKSEVLLLELFIKNANQLVSFQLIESAVYGDGECTMNAINTLIHKLRKKIGKNLIKSISSLGYVLELEPICP